MKYELQLHDWRRLVNEPTQESITLQQPSLASNLWSVSYKVAVVRMWGWGGGIVSTKVLCLGHLQMTVRWGTQKGFLLWVYCIIRIRSNVLFADHQVVFLLLYVGWILFVHSWPLSPMGWRVSKLHLGPFSNQCEKLAKQHESLVAMRTTSNSLGFNPALIIILVFLLLPLMN